MLGCAASGGALAPEPQRATRRRNLPELYGFTSKISFSKKFQVETRWQRFGQFHNDFLHDFLNDFLYENLDFLYEKSS